MNVVFRTDASLTIGTGHVMRCLTLANALRDRGADVSFVCREHEGHLCELITSEGFSVSRLPVSSMVEGETSTLAHAAWLGASWQEDAEKTREVIEFLAVAPDWLIVDHYGLDKQWEKELQSSVKNIFVIDDVVRWRDNSDSGGC